jgi:hypothetical protein
MEWFCSLARTERERSSIIVIWEFEKLHNQAFSPLSHDSPTSNASNFAGYSNAAWKYWIFLQIFQYIQAALLYPSTALFFSQSGGEERGRHGEGTGHNPVRKVSWQQVRHTERRILTNVAWKHVVNKSWHPTIIFSTFVESQKIQLSVLGKEVTWSQWVEFKYNTVCHELSWVQYSTQLNNGDIVLRGMISKVESNLSPTFFFLSENCSLLWGEPNDTTKEDHTIGNHFHGVSSSVETQTSVWTDRSTFLDPSGQSTETSWVTKKTIVTILWQYRFTVHEYHSLTQVGWRWFSFSINGVAGDGRRWTGQNTEEGRVNGLDTNGFVYVFIRDKFGIRC